MPPSFASIKVGDAPDPLVCGPLTRTDFVRYAGASLDMNPNHHDDVYAQRSGNKTVFGMGMLAGGYCARLLTSWLGHGSLRRLRIRFASRFWPDDVLTISAKVTNTRDEGLIDCEFTCVNQAGEVIIRGDATAKLL
jgi:acyl dehydratase